MLSVWKTNTDAEPMSKMDRNLSEKYTQNFLSLYPSLPLTISVSATPAKHSVVFLNLFPFCPFWGRGVPELDTKKITGREKRAQPGGSTKITAGAQKQKEGLNFHFIAGKMLESHPPLEKKTRR